MRRLGIRRKRSGWKWRLAAVAAALAVAVAVWGAGLVRFADGMPRRVADPAEMADAVVVLTGGMGRLEEGLSLLAAGQGRKLFVSGVHAGVDVDQILALAGRDSDALACCIELGHGARDTVGNAAETAGWARRNGFGSLRVVTAGYHMPRTMLEFRHALPDMKLVPHPVFSNRVKLARWWRWPGSAVLVAREYNKYLLARLRLALTGVLQAALDTP